MPYVQLNAPQKCSWLILDVDRPGAALAWERGGLPPPTYIAINRKNSNAHPAWALAAPVCTTAAARKHPLRYLAAIEYAYTKAAGADFAFSGALSKNPLHESWRLWEPANAPVYELGLLAEYVDLPARIPRRERGLGRNCDLFDDLRAWSYAAVRDFWCPGGGEAWRTAILRQAEVLNTFEEPLAAGEVAGIARAVAKFTWRRFSPARFRVIQSERGKRSGAARLAQNEDKRVSARLMHAQGWSLREIAAELDVSKSSVARWVK